mgnify:FL=1
MALTDLQRKKLIEDINRLNINVVFKYFLSGDISLSDVPHITDDRRKFIEEHLPSPSQMDWDALQASLSEVSASTLQKLETYIRKYEGTRPNGNHVDEAIAKYNEIEDKLPTPASMEWEELKPSLSDMSQNTLDRLNAYIRKYEGTRPKGNRVDEAIAKRNEIKDVLQREALAKEETEWNAVDPFSMTSLIGHLNKYPMSAHHDEIDENVWNITDKENVQQLQDYKVLFPKGKYIGEANARLNAIVEWNRVRDSDDIIVVYNYIHNHPRSPYKNEADLLFMKLKQREIDFMRHEPNRYEVSRLQDLVKLGIFTDRDLISKGVMTENVWNTLNSIDVKKDLPDIYEAMQNSEAECPEDYTDVYFFGIPSTGKTCVLMGLSCTSSLQVNLASSGGPYAEALRQYTDYGMTIPRTPGDFVTTLKATISEKKNGMDIKHNVNLVEMSGEEFAFGITNNEAREFSFEEMGTGVTELLRNDNRKVFFLIIDPTTNIVRFNREYDEYDEQTGEKIHKLKYAVVNQKILMQKIVNIFQDPANSDIMKKVDSIHIIVTKADTLGEPLQRDDKALEVFNKNYGMNIVPPLIEVCRDYNINRNSNYRPKLFTFSLGTFYVGGLYEYEETDSDNLVKAIMNATGGERQKTFWDKVRDVLN